MPDINSLTMGRVKNIHFVGIGGAGMSGIAEVMNNLGYTVSGSDIKPAATTDYLSSLDIKIIDNHDAQNIKDSDVVVVSSAIDDNNPEILEAKKQRIPVVRRAEMLAELMRFSRGIAIAGTHGKTTTTSLVTSILAEGGLDPTYVIGGVLNGIGSNAKLGKGEYFVSEADESDASFLHFTPFVAIVTNIDSDHLDAYAGNYMRLQEHFVEFIHQLPFYGYAILCIDHDNIREMIPAISRTVITYGTDRRADYSAKLTKQYGNQTWFTVSRPDAGNWLDIKLNLPGRHNMLNALAAIAVADQIGVPEPAIVDALSKFAGISRRCQVKGEITVGGKKCLLIDDYAHHPTEIAETLRAIRSGWAEKRIVVIYQPHRYSRLRDLFEDFCRVLSQIEILFVLEVYPAGESHIVGADSRTLCRSVRLRGRNDPLFIENQDEIFNLLLSVVEEGDLVITFGAGDIGTLSGKIHERFAAVHAA